MRAEARRQPAARWIGKPKAKLPVAVGPPITNRAVDLVGIHAAHEAQIEAVTDPDARHKLVYDSRTGEGRLFDLEADPGESRDVARERPLRADFYRQELQQWLAGLSEGSAHAAAGGVEKPTPEQCENLKSLGYTHAGCR